MDQLLAEVPLLLLIASRVVGVVISSPLFVNRAIPQTLRAAFAVLLALLMLPVVRGHVVDGVLTDTGLMVGCVLELLVGLIIGFLGQLTFAAVQMAGTLIDMDMGFQNAQIMDPTTGRTETVFTTFFRTLALTVYLLLNGHHWLLRALAGSYETIPAGGLIASVAGPMHVVNLFGSMLGAAVQMVLPLMAVMLLASVALAGISRAVPQMHIFAVGMGVKAVAGLAFTALLIPFLLSFWEALFANSHNELLRTLQLMR